jgi:hypothetical protein
MHCGRSAATISCCDMAPLIYRCPNTGLRVQGFIADDVTTDDSETYEAITCTACRQVHLVNSASGMILSVGEGLCSRGL